MGTDLHPHLKMKPRVRLLSLSHTDWNVFVNFTQEITGRSPTRICDAEHIDVGDVRSYLVSLGTFSGDTLKHVSASFMVQAKSSWMFKIIEFVPKMLTYSEDLDEGSLAIFTGTLEEWKNAIVKLSQEKRMRFLANQCYILLEQNNLDFIFKGHRKEKQEDGTFIIL